MRILLLHGLNCDEKIWEPMIKEFHGYEFVIARYPRKLTMCATQPSDISKWVWDTYKRESIDAIVGHSMGGIVALDLLTNYVFPCKTMIFIESNLRPATMFYRNLLTQGHMEQYGTKIKAYLAEQAKYFCKELMRSVQDDFDYTLGLETISVPIHGIYGNRGIEDYEQRYEDLCLDTKTYKLLQFHFVEDACHLPMIENPVQLADIIQTILTKE